MLICLVLCAAAALPTAFSERPEAQNVQPHAVRNNEMGRRLPTSYAAVRNQGLLRLQKFETEDSPFVGDDTIPSLSNIYIALWSRNPYSLRYPIDSDPEGDSFGRNALWSRSLDPIGGGNLLRREAILESNGVGNLMKRSNGLRALDPIGGGHLLKRDYESRQLDAIGGGNLLKRDALDAIGGGNLLKRYAVDSIGGGNLLKRDAIDAIGGGNLLKRDALDAIGGGNLLKREALDAIGGGNLLKREVLDSIGGGNLLKREAIDPIGGGNLLKREFDRRQLDAIGGGHLLKRSAYSVNENSDPSANDEPTAI